MKMKRKTKIILCISIPILCYVLFNLIAMGIILYSVHNAISDDEIIILTSSNGNAFLVLKNQTMEPETMDFYLYLPDKTGTFNFQKPSVIKKDVTKIDESPFIVDWSGGMKGKGYLYSNDSFIKAKHLSDLKMFRTRRNKFSEINKNLNTISYDKIEY
jgi:hypothetical protein